MTISQILIAADQLGLRISIRRFRRLGNKISKKGLGKEILIIKNNPQSIYSDFLYLPKILK
jgi:hypothetical protein